MNVVFNSFRVTDGAFTGLNKKVIIKCPAGMKSKYKKLLVKKGIPKTAKFK
jgi:hypothetical protein